MSGSSAAPSRNWPGRYGIDRSRVYGIGHSNGAMMAERVACETRLFAAVVAVSGPLALDTTHCDGARGGRILAIHGVDDRNVPVAGGVGPKGLSRVAFRSEEDARRVFAGSGASYTVQLVPGADHAFARIDAVIEKTEGITIAEKAARFFGLVAR
jgi:polyhydroxybutyrate depolymerase